MSRTALEAATLIGNLDATRGPGGNRSRRLPTSQVGGVGIRTVDISYDDSGIPEIAKITVQKGSPFEKAIQLINAERKRKNPDATEIGVDPREPLGTIAIREIKIDGEWISVSEFKGKGQLLDAIRLSSDKVIIFGLEDNTKVTVEKNSTTADQSTAYKVREYADNKLAGGFSLETPGTAGATPGSNLSPNLGIQRDPATQPIRNEADALATINDIIGFQLIQNIRGGRTYPGFQIQGFFPGRFQYVPTGQLWAGDTLKAGEDWPRVGGGITRYWIKLKGNPTPQVVELTRDTPRDLIKFAEHITNPNQVESIRLEIHNPGAAFFDGIPHFLSLSLKKPTGR